MHIIGLLITLAIVGLIAGALARLFVPGKDAMGIKATMVIGVVGSFVGGFLGYVLFGHDSGDGFFQPSGLFGSVVGAVVVLLAYRKWGGNRLANI